MRSKLLRNIFFLFWIIPAACDDHEAATTDQDIRVAMLEASLHCRCAVHEMSWLGELIRTSLNDPNAAGNFYAIPGDNGVVIVHQPFIMSCGACIQYDCQGNRAKNIDFGVALKMSHNTQIYPPF